MAFSIPTLKDLVLRARSASNAEIKGTDASIWPNNLYVTAKVFGAIAWQLFSRLAWMDKQRFAATATGENLERHGNEYKIGRKKATHAYGYVQVVSDYPYTVAKGTRFTRSDGATFDSTSAVSLSLGQNVLLVPVEATTAGKAGNTSGGTVLSSSLTLTYGGSSTSPIVANDGIGQGTDIEDYESLRERILQRKREPPMGGSLSDYWRWARSVPGVTRVYTESNTYGPGTVGVWFLMDDTYTNGIPQPVDVAAVQAYIDTQKPVTATVVVAAPTPDCVEVKVKGLSPDSLATRQSAATELQAVFRQMGGVGLTNDPVIIHNSWLWNAVSNASGERYHTIIEPVSSLSFGAGVVPCLSKVTFIP